MDKMDRLFDAMEHPERYSSPEIEEMLRDPEVKEAFDLLDRTKSSLQPVSTPDVGYEWRRFVANHSYERAPRRFRIMDLLSQKAAASIIIFVVSLSAVAAIVGIGFHYLDRDEPESSAPSITTEPREIASLPDSVMSLAETPQTQSGIVVFENEPFETIISRITSYYGYDATYASDTSKSLRLYFRWNQSLPVGDIVESLNNFDQISLSIKDKTIRID